MNAILMIYCFLSFGTYEGENWRPTDDFLRAVRMVESSGGKFTYGDDGASLGDFQLSEAAWADVNDWRRARRLKTYSYQGYVFHGYVSKVYAANYLTILHGELTGKLGRPPTHGELYAAYNMGLSMFAQCGYNLNRVNAVTRSKCEQIAAILKENGSKESL